MRINIKVVGDNEVQKAIKLLEKKTHLELKQAVTESAVYVEDKAKRNAPVLTGRLRASIKHKIKSIGNKHQAKVGTNVYYAPYVEFGTRSHMAPIGSRAAKKYGFKIPKGKKYIMIKVSGIAKPFLLPALKQSRDAILRFLTNAVKRLKI